MNNWSKKILGIVGVCAVLGLVLFLSASKELRDTKSDVKDVKFVTASHQEQSTLTLLFRGGEKAIQIERADTLATRTQGLSGRKSLAPDTGMLFVFEKADTYGFWMPDMYFAIDILWIDTQKKIIHIEKTVTPESYPKIFKPLIPAQYVLEVPAGFSDQHSIEIGDAVRF